MSYGPFEPAPLSIADLLLQGAYWRTRDETTRLRLVPVDDLGPRHRAAVLALLRGQAQQLQDEVQKAVTRAYVRHDLSPVEFTDRCRDLRRPPVEWIEDTPLIRRLHELARRDRDRETRRPARAR